MLVFGALLAPALPIMMAVYSIWTAFGVVTVLGHVLKLSLFIQNMVTIERAGATSSKAVVFSGITVVLHCAARAEVADLSVI